MAYSVSVTAVCSHTRVHVFMYVIHLFMCDSLHPAALQEVDRSLAVHPPTTQRVHDGTINKT